MEELPFALQRNWRFKEDNGWDASHILKQCKNLTTVYLRLWIFQSWMYKQLIVCLVLRDTLQICKQLVGQNERFDSTQIVNLKVRLCDFYDALTCAKQTKRSSDCLHNNDCGLCDLFLLVIINLLPWLYSTESRRSLKIVSDILLMTFS